MRPPLFLLPFALFLIILPFPGTVAARLLLLAICFGIAVWRWWWVPGVRAPIPCRLALGVWIVVCLVSVMYAFDLRYTLGELKNELGYTMMVFFAFFAIAHERRNALWLLWATGAGLVAIGGLAVATWATHGRVWQEGGVQGGIGVFGTYIVTILPAIVWLAAEGARASVRGVAMALGAFILVLAAIVAQRAVWPVLAVQVMLVLIWAVRYGRLPIGRLGLAGAAAAIAILAFAGMISSQHARFGTEPLSADVRLAFWPKVVASIVERPLAGAGFGRSVMHKAYPDLIPADTPALWHAHNVFLNYGLQLGVPGTLALAGVFGAFAMLFWRAATNHVVAGLAGLMLVMGVLLRNQFNDFFMRDMSLMFWALTGLFARLAVTAKQGINSDQQTPA